MGKFFIINCPSGFSLVWSLAKRFLDAVTVEKIIVLGKDYQSVLREWIDQESLPREFGGVCECEGGCMFSDAGPWNEASDMEVALEKMNNGVENGDFHSEKRGP